MKRLRIRLSRYPMDLGPYLLLVGMAVPEDEIATAETQMMLISWTLGRCYLGTAQEIQEAFRRDLRRKGVLRGSLLERVYESQFQKMLNEAGVRTDAAETSAG